LHANGMVRELCKAGARLLALPVVVVDHETSRGEIKRMIQRKKKSSRLGGE